jgi:putative transposase
MVVDVFSRYIVGWGERLASRRARLDALEMAIWSRRTEELEGLAHNSNQGVQYVAIRYTERLSELGADCSAGSRGGQL